MPTHQASKNKKGPFCKEICKKTGLPCKTLCEPGRDVCYYHNPDNQEAIKAARKEAAKSNFTRGMKNKLDPEAGSKFAQAVFEEMKLTIKRLKDGDYSPTQAQAIIAACNIQLKASEINNYKTIRDELYQLRALAEGVENAKTNHREDEEGDRETEDSVGTGAEQTQTESAGGTDSIKPGTVDDDGWTDARPVADKPSSHKLF